MVAARSRRSARLANRRSCASSRRNARLANRRSCAPVAVQIRLSLTLFATAGDQIRQVLIWGQRHNFYLGGTLFQHIQPGGGGVRQVNRPVIDERATIINLDDDAAAIFQISDPHIGRDG